MCHESAIFFLNIKSVTVKNLKLEYKFDGLCLSLNKMFVMQLLLHDTFLWCIGNWISKFIIRNYKYIKNKKYGRSDLLVLTHLDPLSRYWPQQVLHHEYRVFHHYESKVKAKIHRLVVSCMKISFNFIITGKCILIWNWIRAFYIIFRTPNLSSFQKRQLIHSYQNF